MWCSGDSRHHNVVVARGPSALTADQIKYSVLCTFTSAVIMSLLLIGGLAWMEMGTGIYIIAIVLLVLCCIYPIFKNGQEMYRMYASVSNDDTENLLEKRPKPKFKLSPFHLFLQHQARVQT